MLKIDSHGKLRYLNADYIDYSIIHNHFWEDFFLDYNNFEYYSNEIHYILSIILSTYFSQVLNK